MALMGAADIIILVMASLILVASVWQRSRPKGVVERIIILSAILMLVREAGGR